MRIFLRARFLAGATCQACCTRRPPAGKQLPNSFTNGVPVSVRLRAQNREKSDPEVSKPVNAENEEVRKQLLKEAQARDAPPIIFEDYMHDEKSPEPESVSSLVNLSMDSDLEMVSAQP